MTEESIKLNTGWGYKEIPFCIAVCVIAAFFGGFYARWVFVPDDIGLHMEVAKYMFTDKLGETPEAVGAMAYPTGKGHYS